MVRDLKQQGLDLPTRVTARDGYGSLIWKTTSLSAVVRILHNPAYAGVYVFGRWDYSGDHRSVKTGKVIPHLLPVAKWPVKIELHHPAYLSWEEYVKNGERLRQNWNREQAAGVAREQPNSRRRVTARNEQATSPTNTPCPIHSPFLWRMGGKPRLSNVIVH